MENPNLPLLLLLMFASTVNALTARDLFPRESCAATAGNFTANSTYQTTLTTLLSSISTKNSFSLEYGFFNASAAVAGASQTLYIIGYCNGDLTGKSCRACLNTSAFDIRRLCPLQKEAVLYNENCTIRYSNISIFGVPETGSPDALYNADNVSSEVTSKLGTLMESLRNEAAHGGPLRKYAARIVPSGGETIYAMAQCTPDLTEQQCNDCLKVVDSVGQNYVWNSGMIILAPSCRFRYETYSFFNPAGEPLSPPPLPLVLPPPPLPPPPRMLAFLRFCCSLFRFPSTEVD